jgi:hypothetical protein
MAVLGGHRDPGFREGFAFDVEVHDWSIDLDTPERYEQIRKVVVDGLCDDILPDASLTNRVTK